MKLIQHDNGTSFCENWPLSGWFYIENYCTYAKPMIEWAPSREEAHSHLIKETNKHDPKLTLGREGDTFFDVSVEGCLVSYARIIRVEDYNN